MLGVNVTCNTTKASDDRPPAWLQTFLDRLAADDLSAATRCSYRYDLLRFITCSRNAGLFPTLRLRCRSAYDFASTSPAGRGRVPNGAMPSVEGGLGLRREVHRRVPS